MLTSEPTHQLSKKLTVLLAFSVGALAANLYYAQPLAVPMATSLGLDIAVAGLVVTLTQIGYGLGVLFLVPLGDLLENRKVILSLVALAILALLGIGISSQVIPYFLSAFFLGVGISSVQIIVPYATHLSPPQIRGQVVGNLMSGLMLGIMFSRPIAGFLSEFISWHAVYYFSATALTIVGIVLFLFLPKRQPKVTELRYKTLLASMAKLLFTYSVLRRRAIYQSCMFSAFCLFWTATPILLAGPLFHLSPSGIALFALVGVAGAVFAPLAGKMADRGLTSQASTFAFAAGSLAFAMTHFITEGSAESLTLLTLAAILLDAGVSANLVLGQREIFQLPAELRGRLNSLYIATIFVGGSIGSFLGAWAYARGGWNLTSSVGFTLPTLGLLYFVTEFLKRKSSGLK